MSTLDISNNFDEASSFGTNALPDPKVVEFPSGANNGSISQFFGIASMEEVFVGTARKTSEDGILAAAQLMEFPYSSKTFSSVSTGIAHPKAWYSSASSAQYDCSTLTDDLYKNKPQNLKALVLPESRSVLSAPAIATPQVAQTTNTTKVRSIVLGQPMDTISARLSAGARWEFIKQSELESQQQHGVQAMSNHAAETDALVPYHSPSLFKHVPETKHSVPNASQRHSSIHSFMGSRIFLINDGNLITCINYGQLLYNVDAIQDDGGSDFDSIASPTKPDLSLVFDDIFSSKSSPYDNGTLPTEIYTDEEDYQPIFTELHNWTFEDEQYQEILDRLPTEPDDTSSVGAVIQHGTNLNPLGEVPAPNEKVNGVGQISALAISNENVPKESHDNALDSETSSLTDFPKVAPNSMDAADWTCELARMRLGTESLFTYLNVLEVQNNGKATMELVVTAFLEMVDLEREKRGTVLLPSVCTAYRVLSSLILPHTIMLGTTTVDAFTRELWENVLSFGTRHLHYELP